MSVSALGIGTWAWGDRLFWGYGDRYGEAEVEAAFRAAVEAGVTLFDTAEVYGMASQNAFWVGFVVLFLHRCKLRLSLGHYRGVLRSLRYYSGGG